MKLIDFKYLYVLPNNSLSLKKKVQTVRLFTWDFLVNLIILFQTEGSDCPAFNQITVHLNYNSFSILSFEFTSSTKQLIKKIKKTLITVVFKKYSIIIHTLSFLICLLSYSCGLCNVNATNAVNIRQAKGETSSYLPLQSPWAHHRPPPSHF